MTQKTAETAPATSTAHYGFHGFERRNGTDTATCKGLLDLQRQKTEQRLIRQITVTLTR